MISIVQIEQAINYWRMQHPASGDEKRLGEETCALAEIYAMMIMSHQHEIAPAMLKNHARAVFDSAQPKNGT